MGLTLSAVVWEDEQAWRFLPSDHSALEDFREAVRVLNGAGVSVDSGLQTGGLDRRDSVKLFLSKVNDAASLESTSFKAATIKEVYLKIQDANFVRSMFTANDLEVCTFLMVCSKHELGVVAI